MTTPKPALTDILKMLTSSTGKNWRELDRGLVLAYTPGATNNGIHRLTLSRKGVFPSNQEIKTVKDSLRKALADAGRIPEIISLEANCKNKNTFYHVLFWREGVQGRLI